MKKTKFDSYCINDVTKGCDYCVSGKKLVLFITGKCSRNCFYCSLSNKRKDKEIIFANERKCNSVKDLIEEAIESRSLGAGITGGDPLVCFNRTIQYARALKNKFRRFHIHIYLPMTLVTKEKLKKLSGCIDEIRFHPSFLMKNTSKEEMQEEISKIKDANLFFRKRNIGCEFPILPDKKKEILDFIRLAQGFLGFVNLNELEISDTNFEYITKHYKLNKDTYTIAKSREAGLWILKQCEKEGIRISVHVCTAETKNHHQYKNRLRRHKILPYGYKTSGGSVRYFAVYTKNSKELKNVSRRIKSKSRYIDEKKNRIIISEKIVPMLLEKGYKIARVEEFPTYDGVELEFQYL